MLIFLTTSGAPRCLSPPQQREREGGVEPKGSTMSLASPNQASGQARGLLGCASLNHDVRSPQHESCHHVGWAKHKIGASWLLAQISFLLRMSRVQPERLVTGCSQQEEAAPSAGSLRIHRLTRNTRNLPMQGLGISVEEGDVFPMYFRCTQWKMLFRSEDRAGDGGAPLLCEGNARKGGTEYGVWPVT